MTINRFRSTTTLDYSSAMITASRVVYSDQLKLANLGH